jgi:hypothetical protein
VTLGTYNCTAQVLSQEPQATCYYDLVHWGGGGSHERWMALMTDDALNSRKEEKKNRIITTLCLDGFFTTLYMYLHMLCRLQLFVGTINYGHL